MMERIFQLPAGPHDEAQLLLPWYVTGQLDAADTARVEAHLGNCSECAAQLAFDRKLDRGVTAVPSDVEQGWASMRARLADDRWTPPASAAPSSRTAPQPKARRPILDTGWKRWLGLGLAAQLSLTALLAAVLLPTRFQALSTEAAPVSGNLIVIFEPDTTEQMLRQTLRQNDARLVDGPTPANAYVLLVPADRRAALVKRLRAAPQIVLAEPIEPGEQP